MAPTGSVTLLSSVQAKIAFQILHGHKVCSAWGKREPIHPMTWQELGYFLDVGCCFWLVFHLEMLVWAVFWFPGWMKLSKCTREDVVSGHFCWSPMRLYLGQSVKNGPFPSVLARVRMQNRQQVAIPPLNKHGRWALYTFQAITCKRRHHLGPGSASL
jgi:hypothetical protein